MFNNFHPLDGVEVTRPGYKNIQNLWSDMTIFYQGLLSRSFYTKRPWVRGCPSILPQDNAQRMQMSLRGTTFDNNAETKDYLIKNPKIRESQDYNNTPQLLCQGLAMKMPPRKLQ